LAAVLRATPGVPVVAQGGLTGLVEGTESHPGELIVSFERMNRIEAIDPAQGVALVGAGVTLADLDAALAPFGLMAGVDIGARDSCTIGGMVATNAGGIRVLRYGMMRAGVLGLEVVLASGDVLDLTSP
jgi:FAD/FMN-containing dehydrogenases